jgi:thiosulfate reductase cytochrome b subunit
MIATAMKVEWIGVLLGILAIQLPGVGAQHLNHKRHARNEVMTFINRNMMQKGLSKLSGAFLLVVVAGFLYGGSEVLAGYVLLPEQQSSPLHPTFHFLDENGESVLETGMPVSSMNTCGQCHNTEFIANHSFHADAGLDDFSATGQLPDGRPWDTSPGLFGKWDPLTYRYLSAEGDQRIDLTTAGWIQQIGVRHIGGGPATTSQDGMPLVELDQQPGDLQTSVFDSETDQLIPWAWAESGVVEMNCFLCHTPNPDVGARNEALHSGNFAWANTATLLGSGIVEKTGESYRWEQDAFQANGELAPEYINIQDPTNENCGQCHGLVHDDLEEPLVSGGCVPERTRTVTTGQIISGQKLSDSGINLVDKDRLARSWDVHAERLVGCTDCHFALNNPIYYQEDDASRPDHLTFDPRRLEIGEYLQQPLHQFARGQSAQSNIEFDLVDTMRRCESCHSTESSHDWLPYQKRHFETMSCETCHIPKIYSNALAQLDYTVLNKDSTPIKDCRGIEGNPMSLNSLVTGFEPVLMPREDINGDVKLNPFNLVSFWYWIYGDPPRPVRLQDLQAAYLEGEDYHLEILSVFDADRDGQLSPSELVVDNLDKEAIVVDRLQSLGVENPRIVGDIQPYSINHNVTHGEWVTKDCQECHGEDSRLYQPFKLASYLPGGEMPEFVYGNNVLDNGKLIVDEESGELFYLPLSENEDLYILGRDRVYWVDLIGSLVFLSVVLAITAHAGLRFYATLRNKSAKPELMQVYMYGVYERLWHWLQTFVILLLLFTGLIIHRPDTFGIFSFRYVVLTHNILAVILVINAALSLFYHLASGEIRQYIPRPRGFFDQAFEQVIFYVKGIFQGREHPFEKTPDKKLNPLQQITYFSILNILLPLIGITGILMWGTQKIPEVASRINGLIFLAPFHTLIAWLFASFIVAHVYLTTTGPTPFAAIRAMMFGWDDIEVQYPDEPKLTVTTKEEPVA